ncbi:hypothetical protein GQ457_05G022640 [Hibiscus cannabinus]
MNIKNTNPEPPHTTAGHQPPTTVPPLRPPSCLAPATAHDGRSAVRATRGTQGRWMLDTWHGRWMVTLFWRDAMWAVGSDLIQRRRWCHVAAVKVKGLICFSRGHRIRSDPMALLRLQKKKKRRSYLGL